MFFHNEYIAKVLAVYSAINKDAFIVANKIMSNPAIIAAYNYHN